MFYDRNTEDYLDRELQTHALIDIVRKSKEPIVILSYLTSPPYGYTIKHLRIAGMIDPIMNEPTHPWFFRYCQYVLYRGLALQHYWRRPDSETSDTELQIGTFKLLPKP